MVEIVVGRAGHAELCHDPPRPKIAWDRERNDLPKLEPAEAKIQGGPRAFGGVPAIPVIGSSRQPTSTQGVKCVSNGGMDRPIKPAKAETPGISTAQTPNSCC
jgi:hypothetical protein